MLGRRNYPEGCPLRHPVISKILGRSCLEGCAGTVKVPKREVGIDEGGLLNNNHGVMEVGVGNLRLCGHREIEDQLRADELLGITESGSPVVFDALSIAEPKYYYVNYG